MGGLYRQGGSGLPGLPDQLQWLSRGQVNDMAPHSEAERVSSV